MMKVWWLEKRYRQPEGEPVCRSCGCQVEPHETECVGSGVCSFQVYRCRRCLRRRKIATAVFAVFILIWFIVFGMFQA